MAKKTVAALCALMILLGLFTGCKKYVKEGYIPEPGIALTFDDDRIENWITYLPVLDSLGIKATFYISKYHGFTSAQKKKLLQIQNHGHEIAFHSASHCNFKEYIYKKGHSFEELIKYEVEDELKLMNRDGFYPTAFAYPYGAHDQPLDLLLTERFKSVRALNGTQDFTKSIVSTQNNKMLYGLGIDKSSNRSDPDIIKMLESVRNNKACAVFVAHDINSNNKFSITLERLKRMANFVRENKLKYYTVSEISN